MCFSRADHKNLLPCLFLDRASLDSVSMRTGTSGQTLQKVLYKCNTYLSITLIAEMRYVKYIKSERKTDSEGLPSSREKLSLHNKVIIFGHQYNYSSHTSRADLWDPKLAIHYRQWSCCGSSSTRFVKKTGVPELRWVAVYIQRDEVRS